MKVFDFDNTLYKGESAFDFAMFVVKKKKSFMIYIPVFLKILFLYKICKMNIEYLTKSLEKYAKPFLENKDMIQNLVTEFWNKNNGKLYPDMLKMVKKEDVIITTSPDFLIQGIKNALHTDHVLSTKLDIDGGKIEYLNFQENKVKYFKLVYPKKKIKEFYTDSYNDQPLMDISEHVYLVKNGRCKKIK